MASEQGMPTKLEKTLPTDRHRGGNAYVETRSSAFYIRLGYLAGLGRSSVQIAEEFGGEVNASYLRSALRRAGIAKGEIFCQVPLTNLQRYKLAYKAERDGVTPEEWLRKRLIEVLL